MAIFSYVFGVLIACVSFFVYKNYVNTYPGIVSIADKRYDYIIVGAGTAGCVLASRLSEDPQNKVLLIEAGDIMSFFTKIPLTATAAQQGPYDWSVRTTPQKYSSFGLWDQTQYLPRGKGLGGSGQINFLLHGLGFPGDFARWSTTDFSSWTTENLRPYFKKAFGTFDGEFDSEYCLENGKCFISKAPMYLKKVDSNNELMQIFKKASKLTRTDEITFREPTATVKHGVRHSTFNGYLKPALKRTNLHLLLRTQAVSIGFDNTTATSLFILQNHRELNNVFAKKEIILAAGAIKSPQILILSGIGPREDIQRLKIKLIAENSKVGKNLHDHMNMPLYVSIDKPITITLAKIFTFHTLWDYIWNNKGLLSFPPVAGIEFTNTSALILFSMGTASEKLLRELSNYKPQVFRDTFPFHNQSAKEGFMFLATCLHPKSRGSVKINSYSSAAPPVVNPNYLKDASDIRCMIKAIRRAEELVSSRPFQQLGARIHWPRPERCRHFWNYTREEQLGIMKMKKKKRYIPQLSPPDVYIECVVREVSVTGHHAAGTCAGGTVVDDHLRVKGVSRVRVVDASVMPSPVSLFPNSILVGVAERAADLILGNI